MPRPDRRGSAWKATPTAWTEAEVVSRGVVELRGWVPSRLARTVAGRAALAVPGIESVINSILVRGEDDQARAEEPRANDQTA